METPEGKPRTVRSLTASLTAAFLALSAVVLLVSSGIQTYNNIRTQQEIIFGEQKLTAQTACQAVANFVRNHVEILETATRLLDLHQISLEDQRQNLQTLIGLRSSFKQVALLDFRREIVAGAARHSMQAVEPFRMQIGKIPPERLLKGEKYISPVYIDPSTSEPLVTVAVPVYDVFSDFRGCLAAEVNLKFMWDLVDSLKVGEKGQAFVVDRGGNLIAFEDTVRVLKGENVGRLKTVEEFIANPVQDHVPGMNTYDGMSGGVVVGTYASLGTPDWAVVTELPWEEAYRGTIRNVMMSLAITLAIALAAGVTGAYVARRLAAPIVHLTEIATRIAGGERKLQASVEGPGEVVSLAAAFNGMTAQLSRSLEGLEQRVTEVLLAEEHLRQVNATLQALFDHSPLAIVILDPENHVLLWNNAAEKMFGWSSEEVLGHSLPTLSEEQTERQRQLCEWVMAGGSFTDIESEQRCRDGSSLYVNLSLAPLRDAAKNPYAVMIVGADVTERKRVQDALLEREELFRAIFEQAQAAVALALTDTGKFVRVNQKYCDMVGYPREELLQMTVQQVTYPEDRDATRDAMDQLAIGASSGYQQEKRYLRKDGSIAWGRIGVSLIQAAGGTQRINVAVVQDITERKKAEEALRYSEELLREAQALSHVGSWDWDLQKGTRVLSDEMYRIFGYEPHGFRPTRETFADSLHPADRERVLTAFREAIETGAPYRQEFRIVRPDGSERILLGEGILRFDGSGRPLRMIGSSMDITDIRRAEQALRESEQRFRMVVQNADAIIFTMDVNGVFLLSEGRALTKLGYAPGEAVGMSALKMFRDNPNALEGIRRALAGEYCRITAEVAGSFFDTVYSPFYGPEGQFEGAMGVALDVTERRRAEEALQRSEERLRLALSASNQGLYDLNLQTGKTRVSPEYERMLGFEPGSMPLSLSVWIEMVHLDDRERSWQNFEEYISGKTPEYRTEFRQRMNSGAYKWILSVGKIVGWDAEGKPLRMLGTHTDIDYLKHTEEALRRAQFCIDHSRDAAYWLRYDGKLVYVNDAACSGLGYSREELLTMTVSDIDPLFPKDRWDAHWAEVGEYGSDIIESEHKTRDGRIFPVEISFNVMQFDGEKIHAAFARDISERREAQNLLQEREAKLTSIFRAVPVGIGRLVDLVIQEVNDTMCWLTGYSSRELSGRHIRMLYPSGEDYDAFCRLACLDTGGCCTGTIETQWLHKDGSLRDIAFRSTPLDSFDASMGSIFTALDITERKRIEEAIRESEYVLRKSQEVARLGSYCLDMLTGEWISSQTLDEVFGIDESYPRDVSGWLGIVHPEDREEMRDYFEGYVALGPNLFDKVYRIERPRDGRERWVHGLGEFEFDRCGSPIRMIGTIQDITERKTAEDKVRELNEELEDRVLQRTAQLQAAVKELEAFTYSVSHDLRAPLRAMNGFSRILIEDHFHSLDAEGQRLCGIISDEAGRMARLIDDLLSYSRMGRAEMALVRIDVQELVDAVFQEMTTPAEREHIDFRVGPLPAAMSDRTMLHQIWANLIGNAVKFTANRERALIEVGAERTERETVYFIKDNGAGFDMRFEEKLFGVFQRLHSEKEFAGTGVGLAIVQRLVQRHDGRVWAEGEPDKGATFYFALPLSRG